MCHCVWKKMDEVLFVELIILADSLKKITFRGNNP
jgi:hypothetical protein